MPGSRGGCCSDLRVMVCGVQFFETRHWLVTNIYIRSQGFNLHLLVSKEQGYLGDVPWRQLKLNDVLGATTRQHRLLRACQVAPFYKSTTRTFCVICSYCFSFLQFFTYTFTYATKAAAAGGSQGNASIAQNHPSAQSAAGGDGDAW